MDAVVKSSSTTSQSIDSAALALQERTLAALEKQNAIQQSLLKWQIGAFVLLSLGVLVAILALWRQNAESARALKRQTVASVYSLGIDVDKLAMQTPAFRRYFAPSADYFNTPKLPAQHGASTLSVEEQEKKWNEGQLNSKKDFDAFTTGTSNDPVKKAAEESENKALVWASAGFQADYMEYIFIHRDLYEDEEWKGWWQFLCQEYDDSPILRQFLARYENTDWWTFLPAVRSSSAGRQRYYDNKKLFGRQM